MEAAFTNEELYAALMTCLDSAPGSDGIPYSVYKKLWGTVGNYILKDRNNSYEIGKMAPSHSELIIVLMPKEGKDIGDIKNWRPLTMSNCDSKIITNALALRMSNVLDDIMDVTQTAYVRGRLVSDNLRSMIKLLCKYTSI